MTTTTWGPISAHFLLWALPTPPPPPSPPPPPPPPPPLTNANAALQYNVAKKTGFSYFWLLG